MHSLDEDFIETGINSRLAAIVAREQTCSVARRQCILYFAGLCDPGVASLLSAIPEESHGKRFSDDYILVSKNTAVDYIKKLVLRVAQAPADLWPTRTSANPDKWIAPTLTLEGNTKIRFSSVTHGAPGYALFLNGPKSKPSQLLDAADGDYSNAGGCCMGVGGCVLFNVDLQQILRQQAIEANEPAPVFVKEKSRLQTLICGHQICTFCQPGARLIHDVCKKCGYSITLETEANCEKHLAFLKTTLRVADLEDAKCSGEADVEDGGGEGEEGGADENVDLEEGGPEPLPSSSESSGEDDDGSDGGDPPAQVGGVRRSPRKRAGT